MQVRCDHRGEPKGAVQAATVEPPAELLQGAEGSGGRPPQQPPREPHAVQQAPQAGQHHQPCECLLAQLHKLDTTTNLGSTLLPLACVLLFVFNNNA